MRFITDRTINMDGWELSYKVDTFCSELTEINYDVTQRTAFYIDDGSKGKQFSHTSSCSWRIQIINLCHYIN